MTKMWSVVPLSKGQLLDVRPEDVLEDGLFRRCATYRGGGGYDQFPHIAARRLGGQPDLYAEQFIVQLRGCNLDCHYCYVTRAGVWGRPKRVSTEGLVEAYVRSGLPVFHLMGGAPALQLPWWRELIEELSRVAPWFVFHSDLMLTERPYWQHARTIVHPRCLYAIDIKGLTKDDWLTNTRRPLDEDLFWTNWIVLQEHSVPAYVTFTGVDDLAIERFWEKAGTRGIDDGWRENAFNIGLIDYNATSHVDDVEWRWRGAA